jgi:carboxylate-amine ligase
MDENRFLAARDGMKAELIHPAKECRVPALELLGGLLEACAPHASDLGCAAELRTVSSMAGRTGAQRQLDLARGGSGLSGLVGDLSQAFLREGYTVEDSNTTAADRP